MFQGYAVVPGTDLDRFLRWRGEPLKVPNMAPHNHAVLENWYRLKKGEQFTGEPEFITGAVAARRNKRLRQRFIGQLDTKVKGARLHEWCVVPPP